MKRRRVCECDCPPNQHLEFAGDGSGCINCPTCTHYVEATQPDPTPAEMFGGPR